jgi:hypothetical protein
MKFALLVAMAASASAADVTGTWKAVFLDGVEMKTVSTMTFDLSVDGNRVAGMAHMGVWPADAPLSEGGLDGNRIAFTAVSDRAWSSSSPAGKASGFPKLDFTGTIRGNQIEIKLVWSSVMRYGEAPKPQEYRMLATKVEP